MGKMVTTANCTSHSSIHALLQLGKFLFVRCEGSDILQLTDVGTHSTLLLSVVGRLFYGRHAMIRETFGQRLTALRKKEGWSQELVADKLGISQQGYSRYENDVVTDVPLSKLSAFSTLFNVPLEELALLALSAPTTMSEKEPAHAD